MYTYFIPAGALIAWLIATFVTLLKCLSSLGGADIAV